MRFLQQMEAASPGILRNPQQRHLVIGGNHVPFSVPDCCTLLFFFFLGGGGGAACVILATPHHRLALDPLPNPGLDPLSCDDSSRGGLCAQEEGGPCEGPAAGRSRTEPTAAQSFPCNSCAGAKAAEQKCAFPFPLILRPFKCRFLSDCAANPLLLGHAPT